MYCTYGDGDASYLFIADHFLNVGDFSFQIFLFYSCSNYLIQKFGEMTYTRWGKPEALPRYKKGDVISCLGPSPDLLLCFLDLSLLACLVHSMYWTYLSSIPTPVWLSSSLTWKVASTSVLYCALWVSPFIYSRCTFEDISHGTGVWRYEKTQASLLMIISSCGGEKYSPGPSSGVGQGKLSKGGDLETWRWRVRCDRWKGFLRRRKCGKIKEHRCENWHYLLPSFWTACLKMPSESVQNCQKPGSSPLFPWNMPFPPAFLSSFQPL